MQQSKYKSNPELKFLARMQTGQYMGILVGTVLLHFVITFVITNLVSSLVPVSTVTGYVMNYILTFIVQIAISILDVGMSFILLKCACNMPSTIGDLFCGFYNSPAKALKIGAVIAIINSICMIPLDIASLQLTEVLNSININEFNITSAYSYEFMESYSILYSAMMKFYLIMLVCTAVSSILTLPFFPAYYMILDFPEWNVSMILKKCFEVMNGNKLRLFLLYLSFIPLFLLSMFTCGIALIWVIPYMKMTATNFYLDLMAVRNKSF